MYLETAAAARGTNPDDDKERKKLELVFHLSPLA